MDATEQDGEMLDVWASHNSEPSGMGQDKDAYGRGAQVSATHAHVKSEGLSPLEAQAREVPVVTPEGGRQDAAETIRSAGAGGSPLVRLSAPRVRALTIIRRGQPDHGLDLACLTPPDEVEATRPHPPACLPAAQGGERSTAVENGRPKSKFESADQVDPNVGTVVVQH